MRGEQEIEEQEDPKLKEQLNMEIVEVEKLEQVDEYGPTKGPKVKSCWILPASTNGTPVNCWVFAE